MEVTDTAKKVALVTGGAQGIGQATARLFAQQGFAVAILDALQAGQAVSDEIGCEGGVSFFYPCDVSDERQVERMVGAVHRQCGRIDVLVNNAGIVLVKPLADTTWDEFRRVCDVNLGGVFLLCKHVIPIMMAQKAGAIVNVASVSGHVGQTDHSLYGATKGGIIAFTRALAWEVAPYGIRVNSISPGSVDTPMLCGDIAIESGRTGLPFEEVKRLREAEQAFRRWAEPKEIAEAIYFLASDKASFMTGTDVLVDCGWVAK